MDRWTELELFVEIAERGSMRQAAEALGMSNAAASRHLAALEQRLNARLVERNTRRLFLTDAGQGYYQRCKAALADLSEAADAVTSSTLRPSGTLRVSASLPFCVKHIAPLLPAFCARYPNLRVQLVAANRYYDLVDNHIDVAVRTREVEPDSGTTIRTLAQMRRLLVAAPRYLDHRGTPADVPSLASHAMLVYAYAHHAQELRFERGDEVVVLDLRGLLEANDPWLLRTAAVEGLGIVALPSYIVYDDIVAGRLVPLLPDWRLPSLAVSVAWPSRQHLPAKTRAFVDFLVEHFRQMEYERKWNAS